jgi:serine/threonine protein kinase
MNKINHSSMSKPEGVLEDAKYLYVVMIDDMLVSLVELIEKREKLTEFELKYFFTELYYSVNHLKNQGYVFAKLSMDNIIIDSSVKLNFGFSLWLCEV